MDALLAVYPGDYSLYARLDRCFEQLGGWTVCYNNWKRIADKGDACAVGHIVNKGERIAMVLQSQKAYEEALYYYREVLWAVPEAAASAKHYDWILGMQGKAAERMSFWEKLHQAFPEAAVPRIASWESA